jgi:ethanolamine utilization protein EutA
MSDSDEKKDKNPAGHSLTDHLYGQNLVHVHDEDSDHDHDHDYDFEDDEVPLEDNPLWRQDNVSLTTVGIDIGSSGTQVIFSRVHLRRLAEDLTSRYYVVSRETLFQSPVALTPYQSEERIDDAKLGGIIDDAYAAAKLHPDNIDTGVVILTGEALRRENAQGIAAILSEQGGEFVTATAGHHMESMLAAYGSGAARVSSDENKRILNIDIGGGTTKLAMVEKGKVIATAAVHIGGRLQVVENGTIIRLDPAGKHHAKRAGFSWNRGDAADLADMQKVADVMADTLVTAITARPLPHDVEHLYLTDPIADLGRIDGIMFSGGVAEYIYQREDRDFGDMGPRLGRAIRERIEKRAFPWPVLPAGECIRATALGASEYWCSFPATPATSRRRARCCRAAICKCCSRHSSVARPSTRKSSPTPSATTSWRSILPTLIVRSRSPCAGLGCRRTSGLPPSPRESSMGSPTAWPKSSRSSSCSTAMWRRPSAISCARNSTSKVSSSSSTG